MIRSRWHITDKVIWDVAMYFGISKITPVLIICTIKPSYYFGNFIILWKVTNSSLYLLKYNYRSHQISRTVLDQETQATEVWQGKSCTQGPLCSVTNTSQFAEHKIVSFQTAAVTKPNWLAGERQWQVLLCTPVLSNLSSCQHSLIELHLTFIWLLQWLWRIRKTLEL